MQDAASTYSPLPPRYPGRLTTRRFDALVVGGGINGAGIARDLAQRGLSVALVEQGDFASGTSSASTKLIHGGVRYLERLDFHLVFEACRERRILQTIAPHLVRPLPFFIPVYRDDPRSLSAIRAGMLLYDLLALMRNTHRHSILPSAEAVRREPALRPEGLTGVALYWDCRMDDARLCLENVLDASEMGAEVVNYVEVTALLKSGGRVRGARVVDRESGVELEVEARVTINATGPWLDRLCALDGEPPGKIRPTRGTHILVPRLNRGEEALYLTAGRDDRLFFVIPWGELSLIGTTDLDGGADPDRVEPVEDDIGYLLAETARHLRTQALNRGDVVAAFAGLRPLIAAAPANATRVSREHQLFESPSGLLSLGGGKYTTYRSMAAEVAERVTERLGRGAGKSRTDRRPLPGGAFDNFAAEHRRLTQILASDCGLPAEAATELVDRYGARIPRLLALLRTEPELCRPVSAGSPLLAVEVAYAAEVEFARTPEDVLRRRTPLALRRGRGLQELPAVAEILGRRLDADDGRRRRWLDEFRERHAHT